MHFNHIHCKYKGRYTTGSSDTAVIVLHYYLGTDVSLFMGYNYCDNYNSIIRIAVSKKEMELRIKIVIVKFTQMLKVRTEIIVLL